MITSIFSKSKPINFLIVFLVSFLALLVAVFKFSDSSLTLPLVLKLTAVFLCCFLSVLLVDFIVTKNSLSQKNNTELLLFSLFLLAIPQVFLSWEIVMSNFLILLALRRIISLRTQIDIVKKLFDAGFLIGLASLFYFWSLLFFVLIFFALFFYSETKIKKWCIPFLGLTSIAVISSGFSILYNNDFITTLNIKPEFSFNLSAYNSMQFIVVMTMLFSFGLWSSLFYLRRIKTKSKKFRPSYKVIFVTVIIAGIILVIAPKKNGSEFLFLFAPLTIIISNYIETIVEQWFKTVFVLTLFAIPFILLLL